MASSDSHIDKPQRGHPKRPELPGVNINTGAQRINTEPSLFKEKVDPVREMTAQNDTPTYMYCEKCSRTIFGQTWSELPA